MTDHVPAEGYGLEYPSAPQAGDLGPLHGDALTRLRAADFEELMEFLPRAFRWSTRFDQVLPAIYQPTDEHMACCSVIRRNGRIAAHVGFFPIELRVGDATLRVAGVGGVAVDAAWRGRDLMRRLMDSGMERVRCEGLHLAYLDGQRQWFHRWGFEKCGATVQLSLRPDDLIRASALQEPPTIELRTQRSGPASFGALKRAHDAQSLHCERSQASFPRYLRFRGGETFVATRPDGEVLGYLVIDPGLTTIYEMVYTETSVALQMLHRIAAKLQSGHYSRARSRLAATVRNVIRRHDDEDSERRIHLEFTALDPATALDRISQLSENVDVTTSGNWHVLDWPAVVGSLLAYQRSVRRVAEGRVVLAITGQPRNLELRVTPEGSSCGWTSAAPDLDVDPMTAMRLLFGPLPPTLVAPLPGSAAALEDWCPLPLALPMLDRV